MKLSVKLLSTCVAVALVVGSQAFAKNDAAKGAGKAKAKTAITAPKGVELSEEQKTKLAEIEKELGPKLQDATKAAHDVLTKEQHKARHDAVKAAKASGLKGAAAQESVQKALALSDDQKKKLDESTKTLNEVKKQVHDKVLSILTEEQKAKLKPAKKGKSKTETAKTEPAKTEPAKTEPAKTDAAKPEAPKADAPKTEAPKTDK